MILSTFNETILCFLYTAPIIFCVFISNLLFCMFRWYHASVPLYQNLLINVLFSHLSFIWQAANIFCATYLLSHLVFHLENPTFSWILIELRRFQMVLLAPCLILVSVSQFLAHFKANLYLRLQHRKTGIFTSGALILLAFVFSFSEKIICQSSDTCFKTARKKSFFLTVGIVSFFNVGIVLDIIFKASYKIPFKSFMFPQILPFHGIVLLDTDRMEIPTISANVQEPSNPIKKTWNSRTCHFLNRPPNYPHFYRMCHHLQLCPILCFSNIFLVPGLYHHFCSHNHHSNILDIG